MRYRVVECAIRPDHHGEEIIEAKWGGYIEAVIVLKPNADGVNRTALEEQTRERVPLYWATTQTGLGAALATLGGREGGTAHLTGAVAAYRAALEEQTRERVPLAGRRI